jgi:hypothetical protein
VLERLDCRHGGSDLERAFGVCPEIGAGRSVAVERTGAIGRELSWHGQFRSWVSVIRQSFVNDYGFGLESPPRWCRSCTDRARGGATVEEIEAALHAYVKATGVVPVNSEMASYIPNEWSGQVRDVMAAVRTTMHGVNLRELGLWPWNRLLVTTGVVEGFVETKRGLQSKGKDGHWCLSVFERQVDDFLTNRGIEHEHEPRWPKHPDFNPRGAKRADWRLPDGTMVEAAGMLSDPIYAEKIQQKRAMAEALGIRLVVLTPEQVLHLDQVFGPWLATTTSA